jgi:hypothetical protein
MSNRVLTDGSPVPDDDSHTKLRADGQQVGYVVLSAEERAKGFVKSVRNKYLHVGAPPLPDGARDLTEAERKSWVNDSDKDPFEKYAPHPPEKGGPALGKFFTRSQVARAGKRCGSVTTMGQSIAETYARNPSFYGATFCCACGAHFPLNEFTWEPDGEPMDTRLQAAWHGDKAAREAAATAARRSIRITALRERRDMINSELKELGAE